MLEDGTGEAFNFETDRITGDTTLYAHWQAVTYTLVASPDTTPGYNEVHSAYLDEDGILHYRQTDNPAMPEECLLGLDANAVAILSALAAGDSFSIPDGSLNGIGIHSSDNVSSIVDLSGFSLEGIEVAITGLGTVMLPLDFAKLYIPKGLKPDKDAYVNGTEIEYYSDTGEIVVVLSKDNALPEKLTLSFLDGFLESAKVTMYISSDSAHIEVILFSVKH